MTFIELIGYDKAIYCDTDSIFYFTDEETENKIENKNKELREYSEQIGAYVTVDGEKIYYNQFDLEPEDINKFRFLHAKCYAYEDKGELHCTIAGVNKGKYISKCAIVKTYIGFVLIITCLLLIIILVSLN